MKDWRKIDRDALAALVRRYGASGVIAAARALASKRGGLRREPSLRANGYAVYAAVMVRKRLHPGRFGVGKITEAMRREWRDLPGDPPFPDVATYVEEVTKIAKRDPAIAAQLEKFIARIVTLAKQLPGGHVLPVLWTGNAKAGYRLPEPAFRDVSAIFYESTGRVELSFALDPNIQSAEIDGQKVGILIRASGHSGKQ